METKVGNIDEDQSGEKESVAIVENPASVREERLRWSQTNVKASANGIELVEP